MDPKQKLLNLLGIAQRAAQLVTGESLTLEAIRKKRIALVFVASDASENTKKQFCDKAKYYQIPLFMPYTSLELSQAIGQKRSVIGIRDKGFAKKIKEYLAEIE
ncbi:YlxQ-related RNA-binding protein [Catellicoccus marimammalium]|uniref:Ribosomal protein L7Ae family protein n=1 Tax=Catellicoccus marimammalium M35/04/3 TaxID=1234409 RepID=K8Z7V9_9ENTE|nr:YlxQ-related RNA-binding protein [Catellicoccus marimammalium]EKU26960.1 ribosomal protein L7Ae family protein [Catellicoccus marimammalium M35/04/3]